MFRKYRRNALSDVMGQQETNGSAAIWLVRQPPNSDFRCGVENVIGGYGSPNTLELKLANGLDRDGILDRHQHTRADQNLTRLGFVTEPRGDIRHRPNGRIVEPALEANGPQCSETVRDTDAEADVVPQPTPLLGQCSDSVA